MIAERGGSAVQDQLPIDVSVLLGPPTKVGEVRIQGPTGVIILPIFDPTDVNLTSSVLRIQTSAGVRVFNLVPTTDPDASAVRIQTSSGVRAIALESAGPPPSSGGTLDFDGVNEYVQIPHTASLNLTNEITVEAWVNIDSFPVTIMRVAQKGGYSNASGWGMNVYSSPGFMLYVNVYDSAGTRFYVQGGNVSLNTWTHIAFTYDATAVNLYINGTNVKTTPTNGLAMSTNTTNLILGAQSTLVNYFDGTIDELQIYDRALSLAEIQARYNSGAGQQGCPNPNLVAGYHFDESSGTSLSDHSTNSNNGTLIDMEDADWVSEHVLAEICVGSTSFAPSAFSIGSLPDVSTALTYRTFGILANLATDDTVYAGSEIQDVGIINDPQLMWTQFTYNLSSLGITGSSLTSLTFNAELYMIGGTGQLPVNDPVEWQRLDDARVQILNNGSGLWEDMGPSFIDPAVWDVLDNAHAITWDNLAENHSGIGGVSELPLTRTKTSGFTDNYLNGAGELNIRVTNAGRIEGTAFDVAHVYDYALIDVDYIP